MANRLRSYGHFCISKMAVISAIVDFIEPRIAPFDPPTLKTLGYRTKHGVDRMHRLYDILLWSLYCDLETGVQGHSRSSKAALFDRVHTTLYSSSIVNMFLRLSPIIGYFTCTCRKCPPKKLRNFYKFCYTCFARTCRFTNMTMAEIMNSIFTQKNGWKENIFLTPSTP